MLAGSRIPWWPFLALALAWLTMLAAIAAIVVLDDRIAAAGHDELSQFPFGFLFLVPVLTAAVVGSALVIHRPRQIVGWTFVWLSLLLLGSGVAEGYAAYGNVAKPGSLPLADVIAVVEDRSFVPWIIVLTLIVLHIPSGELRGRAARVTAVVAVVTGTVSFALGMVSPYDGTLHPEPPIANPLALAQYEDAVSAVRLLTLVALHVALLAAAGMLLATFWRAGGSMRKQLRWMALASVVLPALVVGAFVAAVLNQETLLAIMAGGFVAVLPITAGLAIERDHLFDIDRLISRGLAYSLLTALLITTFAASVIVAGAALSSIGGSSSVAVAIATLTTAAIARPAHGLLQTALDKRFNRREFDATAAIRRFIREPPASASIEDALKQALNDESLTVVYWIDDRSQWVTEDGREVAEGDGVLVQRRGGPVGRVSFDESRVSQRLLESLLSEAGPEMENARLRAAITLQLREVKGSRARIVAAQLEERHRLERNLHDGAQQRLLAVALELRASEVSNDSRRQSAAIDAAVAQLQLAVRELRDLANGLHPAALTEGGLAYALEDLARYSPTLVLTDVCHERFVAEVEEAAWFIACEAVANAAKHAEASTVRLSAVRNGASLHLSVEDDGVGGADPSGQGLRGIADRAEAVGGRLAVSSGGHGTVIRAELPCASR